MTASQSQGEAIRAEIVELIPALRAFARSFCRNASDADDLVQETLLKAIANIDKFEPGTRLKSWLFTIMRNTFYTRIVVAKREAPGSDACVSDDSAISATQEWTIRGKELERALARLPMHYREVLLLVAVMGESYETAAQVCDCAVGTVKSRLNRARRQISLEVDGDLSA
ncbi:RNA polymerase sigma factor (sigma-70 family) [Rhizobium sp. SG_E_25_P2]|jgi:RNA polymerase sigma factor (sigma-70 family)|uniref:sigma-70 family RNA polymerase sigma factor n=1 Tax=Rhizobium sp. SG_E_25_P2 TaxID=2879942 RepID=UPI002473E310|nr:sigma-70 family RNA polymerase sigma factor [Rhizobium sp. SG_E_25_P2]MDH6268903.1 RNA polymerase sigma factor (sigma-70 family) [Rhizobium sp. SG_E_25_P2]